MAEVTIDVNGATVVAAITKESAERLGLAEGKSVVAIVKATDVMIGIAQRLCSLYGWPCGGR
jgi:molybdopterin-binding protein